MAPVNESAILESLNLGSSREILKSSPGSPLSQLLLQAAQDTVEKLKVALKDRDVNTSSQTLSQSAAVTEVSVNGSEVSIGVSMDFYWKFVNYGVNGTELNRGAPNWGSVPSSEKTFHQSILEWIPKRGLMLPPSFQSYDSFAFAIMTNIRKFGVEARPFFTDVVNERLLEALQGPIEGVLRQAVTISIVEPWQ